MSLSEEILAYIREHKEEMYELLQTLGRIPAPSNHEEKRAAFCKAWLEAQGAKGVYIDEALNVVYPVGCSENKPLVVFMAHMDIVFPDTEPLPMVIEEERINAPGIGDDTANLCALLFCAKYVAEKQLCPSHIGILLVANAGEEGLGNLKGSKAIHKAYGKRIQAFYSFDGYLETIVNEAVGSKRFKVEIRTEGGHSYGAFGNRNAIAYMASLISTLYELKVPTTKNRTSYNVGTISGGNSVNAIAEEAQMLYEFRSDSEEDLKFMERHFNAVIECYRAKGIEVNVEVVGERPCSGLIDQQKQLELIQKVTRIIEEQLHTTPHIVAGSTDCNTFLSQGVPSVCLGACQGGRAHTREEWVAIDSLEIGYKVAFELILSYF